MTGHYELKLARNGEYFFNLVASNGESILQSEMYASRDGAENGIASVQRNCEDPGKFECRESGDGRPYFVLKAKNQQVIGQSQMYGSEAACDRGIESVSRHGSSNHIRDLTAG